MLDEIPTDNGSTTAEEPDSQPDNTAPEINSDSSPEPYSGEPHETTSEGQSASGTKKKTAAQVAAEKVTAQITTLEGMLSKTGMDANKMTQDQIKKMQADLGEMGNGPKVDGCMSKVLAWSCATEMEEKGGAGPKNMHLISQKVFTVYMQSEVLW